MNRERSSLDNPVQSEYLRVLAGQVIAALKRRRMNGVFCETPESALETAMGLIPEGATVSQGGSVSLDQTEIRTSLLARRDITFIDPYEAGLTFEERIAKRRAGLGADVFVCSVNAITREGQLVSRDGVGNRVAAMIFGPRKVIIVAGMNKITPDVESALVRIETTAAPMNAIRLKRKTPCVHEAECRNCSSEDRICAATAIVDWQVDPDRIWVILTAGSLGF